MTSPFARHLNTNYVPSEDEIQAIRDVVRNGEDALNDIDQKTLEIEQRMEEDRQESERKKEEIRQELLALAERRKAQKKEVDEHKALLSPIKGVGVDVLTSIFLSVLDVVDDWDLKFRLSRRHPAVVISHVCQRWRELALSTKLLWCHLHIWIPSPRVVPHWKGTLSKLAEMTEVWISRSSGCPLHVKVHEDPRYNLDGTEETDCIEFCELIDRLCSTSSRWKDLDLRIRFFYSHRSIMRLLGIPHQSTPTLTKFRVNDAQRSGYPQGSQLEHQHIISAPTLRSLEIGSWVFVQNILRLPVVWSNLEHLVYEAYSESSPSLDALQALALLQECPNLVTCYLRFQEATEIPTKRSPITLPRLRALSLEPVSSVDIPMGFAPSLILPSLRKFKIIGGAVRYAPLECYESGIFEAFECFGSTLEEVAFPYKTLTNASLYRCLELIPAVTSLELVARPRGYEPFKFKGGLRAARLDRDTLTHLTPQFNAAGTAITQPPLCPIIEVFSFSGHPYDLAEDALVDFIVARRRVANNLNQPPRLREVRCGGLGSDAPTNLEQQRVMEGLMRRSADLAGVGMRTRRRTVYDVNDFNLVYFRIVSSKMFAD